ncbi:mitochondrial ribosomal protein subunit-domain-containing protein [Chiua virens]|nr:mitochondrial ribosomal protein subunit-domain-containing protein [Chiua virens]
MSSSALTRSTFGTLLKHSKFSSFNPRIAQVYTTHGGDAHRGHWGFKRPLPLRRRGAYITVKNVDTPEYQTEWNSAEPQALWVKNWDELKITPQKPWFGEDSAEENIVDSNYIPQTQSPEQWRQSYIPNLEVMSRQEFAEYLEKIRASRDMFLNQRKAHEQVDDVTSYQLSNLNKPSTPWHDLIATQFSQERRSNPRNREIEHIATPFWRLELYPVAWRMITDKGIEVCPATWRHSLGWLVVCRGRTLAWRGPAVWDDPNRTGEVMIRPQKVLLKRWPMVVEERQGLKAAKVDMDLRVWDNQSHFRSNPYTPGSREYIAAEPPRTVQELTAQVAVNQVGGKKTRKMMRNGSTLSLLKSAMAKSAT